MTRRVRAAFIAALACCLFPVATPAAVARAQVREGALLGKPVGTVTAFLGIPYAAAPTGANRWKVPAPANAWTGERSATAFGPSCQQAVDPKGFGPWTSEYVVQDKASEDCLYLNVWTPAKSTRERLPVLFWIYGGGFTSGSGSVPIYDGAALAAKGIIVVSVNYRVGVYGFLAHPGLSAENPSHASGNYGLLDQIAGLRWVRDNIASFGGNASQVTIAGQSAGAASVHHLIASPLAKGLFARAIAQSGSGMGLPMATRATAETQGLTLGADIRELRGLDSAALDQRLAALNKAGGAGGPRFAPIADGFVLPEGSERAAGSSDVPILTGMTANEMTGLNPAYGRFTAAALTSQISSAYGSLASEVQSVYGAKSDAEAWQAMDALSRDRGLASMMLWARERLANSRQPIYAYLWTHVEPGPEAARYAAFHSSEIPYVFGTLDTAPRPFGETDRKLSALAMQYWVNFARRGDPNGKGLPRWPRITRDDPQLLELGVAVAARPALPPRSLELFRRHVEAGGRLGLF